jgi:YbgC/YbaW family acyl-CoA thioester hydrolase
MKEDAMIYNRKIYGYECDIYGHLNNANYLHIYEEARAELLQELGMSISDFNEHNISIYLTRIEMQFVKSITLEETIKVQSDISQTTRLRSIWVQEMYNANNELCNKATVEGVFVSDGKPIRLPRPLFDQLKRRATAK